MKRLLLRLTGGLLAVIFLYFAGLLIYGWASDWQPEGRVALQASAGPAFDAQQPLADTVLSFVTWNVGFGGLGAESDFFYDDEGMWYASRSMVRAPKPLVEKNLQGALDFFRENAATTDFFLLQEVDEQSERSYDLPQYARYAEALPAHTATFAVNYRCPRVPIPVLQPWRAYGKVESGLATFSRWQPAEAWRDQLPGHYPMPDRMFQLDRCIAVHRFATNRGKDLVVINLHNSAYDPGDKIKAIQLPYLRDLALAEYARGNYVVLGGDWNQCPPNFRFDAFSPGQAQGYTQGNVPADFFPDDWRFAYDPTQPTNRKARDPYRPGETFVTLIDYFLVSPNVQIRAVRAVPQAFAFSDHQPVWMEVELR